MYIKDQKPNTNPKNRKRHRRKGGRTRKPTGERIDVRGLLELHPDGYGFLRCE